MCRKTRFSNALCMHFHVRNKNLRKENMHRNIWHWWMKIGQNLLITRAWRKGKHKKSEIHFFVSIDIIKISLAKFTCSNPRTTDTQRLNPQFFAAQIQILIPNKYLGCGYTDLGFCRNNGWIMENMDKGLTVPKWGLIVWPKIPQTPQILFCRSA